MSKQMTRRDLLQNVGIMGATTLLSAASGKARPGADGFIQAAQTGQPETLPPQIAFRAPVAPSPDDLVGLSSGDMIVTFDRRYGSIYSITRKGDPFGTNFIGNELNTPGFDDSNSRWTGDLVTSVWNV